MAELSVVGVGVATADPEMRTVGNGSVVCSVNLAFNRNYQDKNSKWQQETCFVKAQVWGKKAERMAESVKKGLPVYVNGYLKQDSWQTDDGQKRVGFSITLRDFQLCVKNEKKKSDASNSETPAVSAAESNDDLPF